MDVKFIKTGFEMFTVIVSNDKQTLIEEKVHLSQRYDVADKLKVQLRNK